MGNPMEDRFDQVVNEGEPEPAKHYAVFILDRSGSMSRIGNEAVDAFNQQIKNIRDGLAGKDYITAEVSLVTFSSQVDEPELWCTPLDQVVDLTPADYQPGGMTAMYDAVGYAINRLQQQPDIKDPRTSVLVIVISDGVENNSRQFGAKNVSSMVKEMQATGRWTFVYEGANQDLAEVQENTGVSKGNMMSFDADHQGMVGATMRREVSTRQYYGVVSSAVASADAAGAAPESLSVQNFYAGDGNSTNSTPLPEQGAHTITTTDGSEEPNRVDSE